MTAKNSEELLRALLDTEITPERDVPMRRFGADVTFRVRALTEADYRQVREQATYGTTVDTNKLGSLIVAKGCVVPDWTDAELLAKFGPTPADAVSKRLLPGEKERLAEAITDLSGFGDDAVDNAKN